MQIIIKTDALFPIRGRAVLLVYILATFVLSTAYVLVIKLLDILNMKGFEEPAFCMVWNIPLGLILIKMSLNRKVDLYN